MLFIFMYASRAFAWFDETHLAIAKAAGYEKYYNVAGPDMIKVKANDREVGNHYYNNNSGSVITAERVLEQAGRYDQPADEEGHLPGAIISALRNYTGARAARKYAEYHLAFAAHYIADLSHPLHNIPYDDFNKARHAANDGIIEAEALKNLLFIEKNMYDIKLDPDNCEQGLAAEVARIVNLSRELGMVLRRDNRDMTKGEAYVQAGHSASLLRAWLTYCRSNNVK